MRLLSSTSLRLLALGCLCTSASAQDVTFSFDWRSRSKAQAAGGVGAPLNEGRILRASTLIPTVGPQPSPVVAIDALSLGLSLASACSGQIAGQPCLIDVDALSYGNDARFKAAPGAGQARLYFSVDPYAVGRALPPIGLLLPNVRSEGQFLDAASDVFFAAGILQGTLPLGGPLPVVQPENIGVIDGNGEAGNAAGSPFRYPGLGLFEPTPVAGGQLGLTGDNLDALATGPVPPVGARVYFSLDAGFTDPLTGIPNSNSAAANGFLPGAVLVTQQGTGASPTVYAPPAVLGLDLTGPGTDDLDALLVWDNGDGVFQPATSLFQWNQGGADMLLFSVRRGSSLIGQPDSLLGLPIEAGDILMNPAGPGQRPRILIAAENLGLATERSGQSAHGDDLDGMLARVLVMWDCNNNGIEDAVDIANGGSADLNNNGIPDECEPEVGTKSCFCPLSAPPPCGNDDPAAGCENSTGVGALLSSFGSDSVTNDDLVLVATQLPANVNGLWLMSQNTTQVVLGAGLRCVNSTIYRLGAFNSGPGGTTTYGPEIVYNSCNGPLPAAACIQVGQTWHFQGWYRNVTGPCGAVTNLTNLLSVPFSP
ncbi:MAG: hypothetical protein ACKO32_16415 [Planctomycetia bacterium]